MKRVQPLIALAAGLLILIRPDQLDFIVTLVLICVGIFSLVLTMLGLTLLWPFASDLFRFGPLHLDDLALTVGAGAFVLALLEGLKLAAVRWHSRRLPRAAF